MRSIAGHRKTGSFLSRRLYEYFLAHSATHIIWVAKEVTMREDRAAVLRAAIVRKAWPKGFDWES